MEVKAPASVVTHTLVRSMERGLEGGVLVRHKRKPIVPPICVLQNLACRRVCAAAYMPFDALAESISIELQLKVAQRKFARG